MKSVVSLSQPVCACSVSSLFSGDMKVTAVECVNGNELWACNALCVKSIFHLHQGPLWDSVVKAASVMLQIMGRW